MDSGEAEDKRVGNGMRYFVCHGGVELADCVWCWLDNL